MSKEQGLVVILSVCVMSLVVTRVCSGECKEYTHRGLGYKVKGTYMSVFNASSIKSISTAASFLSCALQCFSDDLCMALNYGQDTTSPPEKGQSPKMGGECQLLAVGDEGGDVIYRTGFYHFVMRGNITTVSIPSTTPVPTTTHNDPNSVAGFSHTLHRNCYGNDLPPTEGLIVNNVDGCAQVCNDEPLCRGFAFGIDYNFCWIKSICTSFTYLENFVSYTKI